MLEMIKIDFDDIWQKYSKNTRIEFACFSCFLFINFSSFKPDTEINANFEAIRLSNKRANFGNFNVVQFYYRAMHFSAKRGIAIACRLSVRPSVRLSVCL